MSLFNSGDYGIYNHLGHANTSYVMKLVNSDVDTLTNDNYFFIYSQGCYPGDFPDDCHCRTFHHEHAARGGRRHIQQPLRVRRRRFHGRPLAAARPRVLECLVRQRHEPVGRDECREPRRRPVGNFRSEYPLGRL